jgi:isopenicillin N synthase-like dioxygenase
MLASLNALPVIDLTPLRTGGAAGAREVARQIDEVCTEIGFFLVAGHGISNAQITATRQAAVDFFALPVEEKMKVQRPPAKISRGYNWIGDRSLSYSLGQAAPPDIQEAFAFGPEDAAGLVARVGPAAGQMYAPNIWPDRPPGFRTAMVSYYDAMADLAAMVLRAMAIALDVHESYFEDKFDRQASVARMIRYPAVTQAPLPGQLRAGMHTDYGTMTFVRGDDTSGGLQVQHRQGGWIDVHIPPDQFCCNIGDLMARWSNRRWVSTLHRVAVPPPEASPADRISHLFFQNPNPDTTIRCFESCRGPNGEESYPAITVAEHYFGKLMKSAHSRLDADAADALAPSP